MERGGGLPGRGWGTGLDWYVSGLQKCKSWKGGGQTVCGDKINWGGGGAVGNKMKGG